MIFYFNILHHIYFDLMFCFAHLVCTVPNPDQAFACLDMTYIASLLHHGFGLSTETKLKVLILFRISNIVWHFITFFKLLYSFERRLTDTRPVGR